MQAYAPLLMTRTTVQIPDRVPWFSEEIREAKRERSKVEKRWRKSQLDSDLAVLKQNVMEPTVLRVRLRGSFTVTL